MKRTTVSLPDDVAELVDAEARRRRTSVSEVVRDAIVLGLSGARETPDQIPWAGLFHDPKMVPAERLDEVLKAHWADDIHRDRG
ncbi:MAG TPA: CopG family transcriptional regulator [Thermoanaerobaculia bacterium]